MYGKFIPFHEVRPLQLFGMSVLGNVLRIYLACRLVGVSNILTDVFMSILMIKLVKE